MSNEQQRVGMWGEPLEEHVALELEPRTAAVAAEAAAPGQAICPDCRRSLDRARMVPVDGQLMCKTCLQNRRMAPGSVGRAAASVGSAAVAVGSATTSLALGVVGGAVGALIGGAIWAAIAIATDLEVGYVAVLVGFLAGAGVRRGAGRGSSAQLLAAVLSIAGILAAKYFIFAYAVIELGHKKGVEVSVLNAKMLSLFPKLIVETASPFDALFAVLAIAAAARACRPE